MPSSLNVQSFIDEFLNSKWDQDDSINIEKTYSSKTRNSGRSFFFDNKLIHAYYYR